VAAGVAAGADQDAPAGDRDEEEPSGAAPSGAAEDGEEPVAAGAEGSDARNVPSYGAPAGVSEDAPASGLAVEPSDGSGDAVPAGAGAGAGAGADADAGDAEDEPGEDADGPADEVRDEPAAADASADAGTGVAADADRDGGEPVADAVEDARPADRDVPAAGAAGDPETDREADEDDPADGPKGAERADAARGADSADEAPDAAAQEPSGTTAGTRGSADTADTADSTADSADAAPDAAADAATGIAADDADAPSDDREAVAGTEAEADAGTDADADADAETVADAEDADGPEAPRVPDGKDRSEPRRPGWAAGSLPAEQKPAEEKAAEQKAAEEKASEEKASEEKPAEGKPAEGKSDATRTLGKVAPPSARPDTGGKGSGKPVDQPTTAIRLGGARPAARPPVDQPTTQLKVGDRSPSSTGKPPAGPAGPGSPTGAAGSAPAAASSETTAIPQIGPERTTQQPLPPKPPLDLLAELTNTPPPPDTLPRRVVRRVKIWTPVVVLLAIVLAIVQMVRPLPEPSLVLTAEESFRFDGDPVALPWPDEGQGWMDVTGIGTVDSFGETKPVPIASVTKSMTAYVIMKNHPLKVGEDGPSIPVDALAEKEGGYDKTGDESTLNTVKEGQKLSLRDALSAVMIPSANNIARLLARWDAGSEAAFVEKMNKTAAELGMRNTTYTDPSGLKETTVSTAEDQVKLGVEMMKMPAMVDITNKGSWKDPSGRIHYNYNTLVPYNNAIGIKTGSTTKAGGNLLFAATKEVDGETVTLVGAVLGQHKPFILDTVNAVSKTAMLATQDALESKTILKKGDVVGYVDDQLGGRTPVVVSEDVKAVGWAGHEVKLTFVPDPTMPHAAPEGAKVGSLTVGDAEGGAVKVPVQLGSDLQEPSTGARLTRVS
jgi:D-alanyl-D-alanine carboxypeptidase